jgi:Leucine-rich repeat (LRR) protein
MQVKYVVCIVILVILYCGCVAKKSDENGKELFAKNNELNEENLLAENNELAEEQVSAIIDAKPYIQLYRYENYPELGAIWQRQLEAAGLSEPSSLREIAERVRIDEREDVITLDIYKGDAMDSLDGIGLFPNLQSIGIYNSKIKRITGHLPAENPFLKYLFIRSDELEDISGIAMFENLVWLEIRSESIKSIPDLTRMEKLRLLTLDDSLNLIFNELKLPSKLVYLDLVDCNIKTLGEVSNLFNSCKRLYLMGNQIKVIDRDMDFGTLKYINLARCPVANDYYDAYEGKGNRYILVENTEFDFDYGYDRDSFTVEFLEEL